MLAHHLGVAHYEQLPLPTGGADRAWEEALQSPGGWTGEQRARVVVMVECGNANCDGQHKSLHMTREHG